MIPRLRVVRALSVNFSGGGGVPADKPIVHSSGRDVLPGRGDSAPKLLLVCEQQRGADEGRDTKHGALLAASQRASPINRCVHGRVIFLRLRIKVYYTIPQPCGRFLCPLQKDTSTHHLSLEKLSAAVLVFHGAILSSRPYR